MESREVVRRIKNVILKEFSKRGVNVEEVLLFGSRARGDFREGSDWDVLVVISEDIDRKKYRELWYSVYRHVDVPLDLVIVSKEAFEKYVSSPGFIYYYAAREGVKI
ncbi:nucleotidyltransferase domain-containing protein [Thermococcus sp. 18S1]|uniref:nucleotidyltransferase domain-containing protein n=1 Tax=Thermococcus sp. 18S1 TaxID=1638210 RepID=UPI00143B32EB|nr:nucleotidyltransferase domain-containing protein [Thermococcus sp. 18S1]NJE29790.1 nucleotidyltransferase domain-containing protein [Thermococcus sp. 18S1]